MVLQSEKQMMVALTESTPFRLGHRPALDGVRGLAILLVAVHHTCHIAPGVLTFFSGGFLGVDLFFVLSGFLITSLIIEEYNESGTINLSRFYARRALRLLPAVAAACSVFIILTAALGSAFTGYTPLRLASILGYFTNWVRAFETDDLWFLSHFWSLAIEEQFYLLWPMFLIVLLSLPRRVALAVVSALAVISASLMTILYLTGSQTQRIYTGSDTRAYQLLAGCLLSMALYYDCLPRWLTEQRRRSLMPAVGVVLVTMFVFARDDLAPVYCGGQLLLTICAVFLVLHLTLDQSRLTSLFQNHLLVWFGKRSYGLYVWHFPIYFLFRKLESPGLAPVAVAAAILAAALSYRFIELPFLRMKARVRPQASRDVLRDSEVSLQRAVKIG